MAAPTPIVLENGQLRLAIVPEIGASVVALEVRTGAGWSAVLRPTPPEAIAARNVSKTSLFLLAPWSNRIEAARFQWRGREIRLRPNTPEGYAIHGDVRHRAFRVVGSDRASVECRLASRDVTDFNFPFPLEVAVRYALDGSTFIARLALRNAGSEPMPCGLGFHPYFPRAGAGATDDARVRFVARTVYPPMPSGAPQPLPPELDFARERVLGACDANHCLGGFGGTARLVDPRGGVRCELAADAPLDHVVFFTPPGQPFYAVEPVSICNNGFNLHADGQAATGTRVLAPGEELAGVLRLDAAPARD